MIKKIRKPRFLKIVSVLMAILFINEILFPTLAMALTGGPSQPEVESFAPIQATDMVDLFSGDFKYNIPLLDIDGYPININYNSNITMDQEASWVGLGWNLNPGVISRSMRGLPDDFCGDIVTKEFNLKDNLTIGVNAYARAELFSVGLYPSLGYTLNYNTMYGFSLEQNIGLTKSLSSKTAGTLNLGLSLNRATNKGATLTPKVSYSYNIDIKEQQQTLRLGINAGFPINSIGGLKSMQLGLSATQTNHKTKKLSGDVAEISAESNIGFGMDSYTPQISMPIANESVNLNVNFGTTIFSSDGFVGLGAFYNRQYLMTKVVKKKAYGYMYNQEAYRSNDILLDFNRDKDVPYYESIPVLPISNKTYDVYTIQGQGIGGSFRSYENISGMNYNDNNYNYGTSGSEGIEIGSTSTLKGGVDLTGIQSNTESNIWGINNYFANTFRLNSDIYSGNGLNNPINYEPNAFKMLGEVTPEYEDYINNTGNFEAVRLNNDMVGSNSYLMNKYLKSNNTLASTSPASLVKRNERVKRNQFVHSLNAHDAQNFGLDRKIKFYAPNFNICSNVGSKGYTYTSRDRSYYDNNGAHLSEITVNKTDGSRYIYGIPAYVTKHIESSFSVEANFPISESSQLVNYTSTEDSKENTSGKDYYYQKTILPPYAHSYFLSAVLSPDYIDKSGDGPTDDDLGNYVKFNYRNITSEKNNKPYCWRTPSEAAASYNAGFLYDDKDSKGSYVYGEKEMIYIHSIETKNYIVEFELCNRKDGYGVLGTQGGIDFTNNQMLKIKEIRMYSKKDRFNNGNNAVPIKTVHFIYDYSLCKGIPNNEKAPYPSQSSTYNLYANEEQNQGGKLTLKKIYFTYGNSNKGKLNPYEFKYCYEGVKNNQNGIIDINSTDNRYNPDYHLKGCDRWGFYKPEVSNQLNPSANLFSYEFPYVDQRKIESGTSFYNNVIPENEYNSDVFSCAWNLTGIKLPSGADFNIVYESDDYAYVQNQRAMQMCRITGFSNSPTNYPGNNTLFESPIIITPGGVIQNPHNICFIELPESVNTDQEFKDRYLDNQDKLYFKARVKIKESGTLSFPYTGAYWENISGYANISSYGIIGGPNTKQAYVILNDFDLVNVNPISAATWRFCIQNEPGFINGKEPMNKQPSPDIQFLTSLNPLSIISDLIDVFKSPWTVAESNNIANEFMPDKSWVRLQNPNYSKKGGGSRVKKITINDNWTQDANGYGQEYIYKTKKPNNPNLEISSGVAAYEPQVGGDENSLHQPIYYKTSGGTLQPDNYSSLEEPIGEAFFPAPTVGYQQVTVKTIYGNNNIKRHKNGITVTEFYTARDFPVKVEKTPINEVKSKTNWLENMFSGYTYNKVAVSQGFVIKNNDMHGKIKAVKNYSSLDLNNPISGEDYYYNIVGNELNNTVNVLKKNGDIESKLMGVDYDIYNDFRENDTDTQKEGAEINLSIFAIGIIPFILPPVWFTYSENELLYRSAVTTKSITSYGILKEVVKYDQSSKVKTSNFLFDAETGDVLLTKTQNAFNDPSYSFKYPAHWAYKGMEPAYVNTDIIIKNCTYNTSGNNLYTNTNTAIDINDFLLPGDEVAIYFSGGFKTGWILYLCNQQFSIVDRLGKKVIPNSATQNIDVRVVNSGRKNQQTNPIGTIASKLSPIPYLTSGNISPAGIIQSEAVEYDNTRKLYWDNPRDTCILRTSQEMKDLIYFLNDLIAQNKLVNNIGSSLQQTDNFNINVNNFSSFSNLLKTYANGYSDWVGHYFDTGSSAGNFEFGLRNGSNLIKWGSFYCPELNSNSGNSLRKIIEIIPSDHNYSNCNYSNLELKIVYEYSDKSGLIYTSAEQNVSFITNNGNSSIFNEFEPYYYYYDNCGGNKSTVNPFTSGIMGNWYPRTSYKYLTERTKNTTSLTSTNLRDDGIYKNINSFWKYNSIKKIWEKESNTSILENWKWTNKITVKDNFGNEIENINPLGIYSAALYGYNNKLPIAVANNATHREILFENFEELFYNIDCNNNYTSTLLGGNCYQHSPLTGLNISNAYAHTGKYSMVITNSFVSDDIPLNTTDDAMITYDDINQRLLANSTVLSNDPAELKISQVPEQVLAKFSPQKTSTLNPKEYIVSYWICAFPSYNTYEKFTSTPILTLADNNNVVSFTRMSVGEPIDGWQKIEWKMVVPSNIATGANLNLKFSTTSSSVYIDDLRIFPIKSSMKTYVYDDINKRFIAELDENNYATFYEYDEDGALVRIKKETEKGIFTIKEVRKSLIKH